MTSKTAKEAAEKYAKDQDGDWPYGVYHPNDMRGISEKAFLAGYEIGAKDQRERDAGICREWPHDYRSKDGLMVLSSRFDIANAIEGRDDRDQTARSEKGNQTGE